MTRIFLLILLFFTSAIVQIGIVNSFSWPLSLLPLHFLLGVIVLHRSGPELGASWFVASAFTLPMLGFDSMPWITYIFVAIAGILLTTRLFTNRSVYALEGLVLSLYCLASAIQIIARPETVTFSTFLTIGAILIIATYVGFLFAKFSERILYRFFLVRNDHATI